MHLLLFDIDGTLLLTHGAGIRAMANVGARMFGPHFTLDQYDCSGKLDPIIYGELAARFNIADHAKHHDTFRDQYLVELQRLLNGGGGVARALPGMREALDHLRRRDDVMLGLLTGNYTQAVPIKLAAVDMDPAWFTLTSLGDEAQTRPDLVKLALQKFEMKTSMPADPRRTVVIGDTPRDIDCAHAHGCIAFAVATGRFSVEELAAHNPEVVVPNLSDPQPLYDLLHE